MKKNQHFRFWNNRYLRNRSKFGFPFLPMRPRKLEDHSTEVLIDDLKRGNNVDICVLLFIHPFYNCIILAGPIPKTKVKSSRKDIDITKHENFLKFK